MQHVVGVADMKIADGADDVIVTYALGSCLGICVHDAMTHVGGILHVMLPTSSVNKDKALANPYMFVDTGVPAFFKAILKAGASKARMTVKVVGGACTQGENGFAIGKRNCVALKKMLWKNGVLVAAEDVGGTRARTVHLHVGTGQVCLSTAGVRSLI